MSAKHELMSRFTATPFRPTGLSPPDQALANAVELLEWCTALITDMVRERADLRDVQACDRELLGASAAALRGVASLLCGGGSGPDVERLERAQAASVAPLGAPSSEDFRQAARLSFHTHAVAVAALAVAADALVASRLADPDEVAAWRLRALAGPAAIPVAPLPRRRLWSVADVARRDASVRSVWFINSIRGAVALAIAVAVADLSGVQHGFWVVLGTLSVLRTNAASTGSIALRALWGTAVGFAIGGALLVVIGSSSAALWAVLPVAVFVAAYAPGTAPFAVGQAAFTVTVAVIFNLLVPVGWEVGVVRIEDVALGCAVSVLVGVMFWPRGLTSLVGDDLADAFRLGASYLNQAVGWASGSRGLAPDGAPAASAAGLRLDDALRALLAEQGTKRIELSELWRLVGGTQRLRLTAHAVAGLPPDALGIGAARDAVGRRTELLTAWYERLGELLGRPHTRAVPELDPPRFDSAELLDAASGSQYGVWLCEHLDHLAEHLCELVRPAARIAEVRRRPWWR